MEKNLSSAEPMICNNKLCLLKDRRRKYALTEHFLYVN